MTLGRWRTGDPPCFVDVFAGCGGLSLGLLAAGWKGLFAIEKDAHAFLTLQRNLIDSASHSQYKFEWPQWLPKEPAEIETFIATYEQRLIQLRGKVDLLAGGPPCQGFSLAGRRNQNDPRNRLFHRYLDLVRLLEPKLVLIENVRGIAVSFRANAASRHPRKTRRGNRSVSDKIFLELRRAGYSVFSRLIPATSVGVPQLRPRFIIVGIRSESSVEPLPRDVFDALPATIASFLRDMGLPAGRPVSSSQALSDLEVGTQGRLIPSDECPGFFQARYSRPKTRYQRLLHGTMGNKAPNSMRLANHTPAIKARFERIVSHCPKGVSLSDFHRRRFGVKKHTLVVLDPRRPSHTLTTLPDDLLHYSEPRILTVREYARLQSFPDWFEFLGKYTTGGDRRTKECPRYTQVGNAVPPFLATVLGRLLLHYRASAILIPNRRMRRRHNHSATEKCA